MFYIDLKSILSQKKSLSSGEKKVFRSNYNQERNSNMLDLKKNISSSSFTRGVGLNSSINGLEIERKLNYFLLAFYLVYKGT